MPNGWIYLKYFFTSWFVPRYIVTEHDDSEARILLGTVNPSETLQNVKEYGGGVSHSISYIIIIAFFVLF
jgi:hypothetical protein